MPDWTLALDTPSEFLLALLLAGHVFSDFLVQTGKVAAGKRDKPSHLLLHGGLTLFTHLVLVLPFWNPAIGLGVFILSAAHTGIDAIKAAIERRAGASLGLFLADQVVHVLLVVAVWVGLTQLAWGPAGTNLLTRIGIGSASAMLIPFNPDWMPLAGTWIVVAAGLAFNGKGGTAVVRLVLERFPEVVPRDPQGYKMGRTIGVLERLLLFILVLLGQWGALGLVLAAKSIARFKELSAQPFADYYLIGTLTSILVAITTAVVVRILVVG